MGIALVSAWAGCGLEPVRPGEEVELSASSIWIIVSVVLGLGPLETSSGKNVYPVSPHLISADSGSVTHYHLRSGDPWLGGYQVWPPSVEDRALCL